jgi:hypothetical protein
MPQDLFFTSPEHQQRFLTVMQQCEKIYEGQLDPEYATAFYLLTAHAAIWDMAQSYVFSYGIDIEAMLEEVNWSSGYLVLIKLAGNLFNNQQHLDPLEFLCLDPRNFQLALTALIVRRSSLSLADVIAPCAHHQAEVKL